MFRRKPKWDSSDDVAPPLPAPAPARESRPSVAVEWSASGLIRFVHGTTYSAKWSSKKELGIIKKEIRLRQKSLRLEKKLVSAEMAAIRTSYRQKTAQRGPSIRGGGNVGRVFRTFDQMGRSNDRSNRERELAPLEVQKADIDLKISQLDQFLIQIELAAMEEQ